MYTAAYYTDKNRSRDERGNDPASTAVQSDRLSGNSLDEFATQALGHPCHSRCPAEQGCRR
jgi:hypothetical protein